MSSMPINGSYELDLMLFHFVILDLELLTHCVYEKDDLEKNRTDYLCFEIEKHMFSEDHMKNTHLPPNLPSMLN